MGFIENGISLYQAVASNFYQRIFEVGAQNNEYCRHALVSLSNFKTTSHRISSSLMFRDVTPTIIFYSLVDSASRF